MARGGRSTLLREDWRTACGAAYGLAPDRLKAIVGERYSDPPRKFVLRSKIFNASIASLEA